jgi:ABC-type oligopeptide transport system substrate-binding subunit
MTDTCWMNMYGDGNAYLAVHYMTPGRVNFSSYEEIDAVLAKESSETDPAARQEIVSNELFPLLVDTCTNFPLYDSVMVYGHAAICDGVEYLPNSNFRFADIYFK